VLHVKYVYIGILLPHGRGIFRQEWKRKWRVQENLAFETVFFKRVAKEGFKIDGR
jgi:hypothetical protein